MNNLGDRLRGFDGSLKDFKAETYPSWQTAEIFNALLADAKQQFPDDSVAQAISPAEKGVTAPGLLGKDIAKMDVGSMRAAVRQIRSLTGGLGPSVG
jgi:hypothetical protein